MAKMLRIDECRECKWRGVAGFAVLCRGRSGADRLIYKGRIGEHVPIPHWCPLLDVATIEAQRDALVAACEEAVSEIEYAHSDMLTQEERSHPRESGWARVYDRLNAAVRAVAPQSGFMEDGARWPEEARKPGAVYDSDRPRLGAHNLRER